MRVMCCQTYASIWACALMHMPSYMQRCTRIPTCAVALRSQLKTVAPTHLAVKRSAAAEEAFDRAVNSFVAA